MATSVSEDGFSEELCNAEDVSDAQLLPRDEVLAILEQLVLELLGSVSEGTDPQLLMVNRTEKNVIRDTEGRVHLGKAKTVKHLFGNKAVGTHRFAMIWQVVALVHKLLLEGKMATQREAYYCLVQHFRNQDEFNSTLQDVVALTGCARVSLGICASSSGAIAGLVQWQDPDGEPEDCSTGVAGKRIPGVIDSVKFISMGARYILVVEKDAVFTYLCGQRIWDTLPCIIVTGCGYPPLSVRAVVKTLVRQLKLPVVGLFDYNPHGVRILLTYKFGSTRMGTESHAHAVDIRWLGVHHADLFGADSRVPDSALQQWASSDECVHKGVVAVVEKMGNPYYSREIRLMGELKVKAEIEALNSAGFDTLEQRITTKILRKSYF